MIRYGLLWITAILLIFRGFRFIATSIPNATIHSTLLYSIISTLFVTGLTIGAYTIISKLIHRYLLISFKVKSFLLGLLAVHVVASELVYAHFILFYNFFSLNSLPRFYAINQDHIKLLYFWQAPFDSIIVWLFSFSLFYNYLLYAIGIKVFKDLFTIQIQRIDLEKENLRLEIKFLKAQLNPHFLFNTLNNIYSFSIHSPQKVTTSILKLSDMMRYMLYETNDEQVLLSKEIIFLTSYIDLQRLRHDEFVSIQFTINGRPALQEVPPLLFLIFIENAFKHGIQSTAQASWVNIQLTIKTDSISLFVINSVPEVNTKAINGIGIRNAQKRLEHFYPARHKLSILSTAKYFSIDLYLDLHETNL